MKTFVPLIFLVLYIEFSHAQNGKIDSLNRLISKSNSDTQRINLTVKKIDIFNNNNLDSAISIGNATVEFAKKISYKKGEANARARLAYSYSFKGEYEVAKEHLATAEKISASIEDSSTMGQVYANYGTMYGMQSKYDSAIMFYQKSIDIALHRNDKLLLSRSYSNIATSYQMLANYSKALFFYQKALKSAEEDNDINRQAYLNLNIALTFTSFGDTARSEQTYLKSISLAKRAGLKNVELYAYSNLSSLYLDMHKFKEAYEVAWKSATLAKEMGDKGIEAASLSKGATALAEQKLFREAEELNSRAMAVADSSKQPLSIYQANTNMGLILKMQKKYREAIPYFEKGFHSLKDGDLYDGQIGDAYSNVSECYEKIGDYGKALTAHKMSAQIADSVRNKENIRKATELTMNFEFEKQQAAAKAEQQKKDAVTSTRQLALLLGLLLTLILAGGAFYAFRSKKRANILLEKQKKEIQITLSELKATQAQLIQSEKMASLGELTAGIAHEIQNPLNFVNNFSEVNKELLVEMKDEMDKGNLNDAKSIANDVIMNQEKINYHGKKADAIVKGMLQHSRSSSGVKEPTDINALADEYLRLSYHGFRAKEKAFNAALQTDFDESVGKINIIPQDIGRVLLNLYNNAFYALSEKKKHAPQSPKGEVTYEPTVSISTKKLSSRPTGGDGGIEIRVSDNGFGIPQKVLDKIFQPFFTTKPTGQGTGLGLSLAYDTIKAHGGEIRAESSEGEGAEFVIQLPITV